MDKQDLEQAADKVQDKAVEAGKAVSPLLKTNAGRWGIAALLLIGCIAGFFVGLKF